MWADMAAASRTSDPKSVRLDDHAAEGALRLLQYGLEKAQKDSVVTKGAPQLHPDVVKAHPTSAPTAVELEDCMDDTKWLQYKLDGTLKNQVPGSHHHVEATVTHVRGEWKVTKLYVDQAGSC